MAVDADALRERVAALNEEDVPTHVTVTVSVTNVSFLLETLRRAQEIVTEVSRGLIPDEILEVGNERVAQEIRELAGALLEGVVEELDAR